MWSLHFVLVALALLTLSPLSISALPRSRHSTAVVYPHHLRIAHHLVDTHPDLVVDSPHPHFTWELQAEVSPVDGSPLRGVVQTAYQLDVVAQSPDGTFPSTATSAIVHSNATTQVQHPLTLQPNTHYLARVKYWSSTGAESEWVSGHFRTGMMDTWRAVPAQWIGSRAIPMHQVKKEFTLPATSATITSAVVQYSGIGYSTLWVNGAVVDPSRKLDPGWTTFQKRTLYVNLDVTKLLVQGLNAIGVELGNGWYAQEQFMNEEKLQPTYGPPRLWLWLSVNYSDSTSVSVYSDNTWLGACGPNIHDGVYMGSIYDARWARPNWAKPGDLDRLTLWTNASVLPSPLDADGVLALQIMDPIRTPPENLHFATKGAVSNPRGVVGADLAMSQGGIIHPTQIPGGIEGQPLDLGQNLAGWCQVRAKGMLGLSVMMRYAESLTIRDNPQVAVSLYTENLRNAASTDIIIFAEDDTWETFEPPFTVHGFRYLEFRGAPHAIAGEDVTCMLVHSETTVVGNWTSSSTVMNQIQHNIQWGQLSNMMSIPTDCPQRDERKGWMGDAGLTVDEGLFNFDTAPFYINFLNLIRDVQLADGEVPNTVPEANAGYPPDPNWGTALPQITWALWQHYGDKMVLQEYYPTVKKYVEYLRSDYKAHGLGHLHYDFGDWVPPPPFGQTDRQLIAAFPFLRDVQTVIKMATVLNDTATVKDYTALYATLAAEFHSTWYKSADVGYADGMQAANILALALPGVVPANLYDGVMAALIGDIEKHGHFTTGIVSVAQLFPLLSAHGHHDLALQLAQMTSYPSYGWMFTNAVENATTLWELWDSPVDSTDGPEMDSRNHIMFGSIGAWFYRDVAGINLDGLEHTDIRPRMAMDHTLMPSLQAEVVTRKGAISVDYHRQVTKAGHAIVMTVEVPSNTLATVHFEPLLPQGRCVSLAEGGQTVFAQQHRVGGRSMVEKVAGVQEVTEDAATGVVSVRVVGGVYQFEAQWE